MKQTSFLPILAFALLLGACGADSSLPTASGKGTIRAINGISSAPAVAFLIEEQFIGSVDYRQITPLAGSSYDDLSYTFNFEVRFIDEDESRRIASRHIDVIKDTNYILLLTGTLGNPSMLTLESTTRDFDGADTVFEVRFAHTADSLGSVDYYFAAPGIAPVLGEAAGTLSFGDVLTSVDYTAGDFVLTVTASGDPGNVLYQSGTVAFTGGVQYVITTFDGDANTFAPVVARAFAVGGDGATLSLPDITYPAATEFVHGSIALNDVDIYDDEMLTSQIVDNLAYKAVSAELNLAPGENTFYVTPPNALSPVHIEDTVNFFAGIRGRTVLFGAADALRFSNYLPDRRPVVTHAKLQLHNSAVNVGGVNIYVVTPGTAIEDVFPTLSSLVSGNASAILALGAGSFELYVTEAGTNDINVLAGPVPLDTSLGDIFSGVIFDTADPAAMDVEFLPNNP